MAPEKRKAKADQLVRRAEIMVGRLHCRYGEFGF